MEAKYQIDTEENKGFLEDLREDLLYFGRHFPSPSGASYYLGGDGTPWKDRPRETWITCRMAHVYSIGAMLGFAGAGELADDALRGLTGVLRDKENGGWYSGVEQDQSILPGKQCYAHAFVLLAASSALLAGRQGARELLDEALALFEKRFWDEETGLTFDTWDTEFSVLDDYRGLNANMHTVEAFLAVADALERMDGAKPGQSADGAKLEQDANGAKPGQSIDGAKLEQDANGEQLGKNEQSACYRARAGRIIDRVIGWARDNDWRIPEHYTKDWTPDLECNRSKPDDPFKPYGATPGHGIEWARLIVQWAIAFFSEEEKRMPFIEAACKLYDRAVSDAWYADGAPGLVYTTDWNGVPVVHDRMHWTMAEAVNAAAVLYRVTGDARYARDYADFWQYIDEMMVDYETGSWYHQLDAENRVIGTVWPGKPDIYHAFQATLIPYGPADVSIASAVKTQGGHS